MKGVLTVVLLAILLAIVNARKIGHQETRANLTQAYVVSDSVAIIPKSYTLFKQCGESWSNDILGTGSVTICDAGCAMSSLSMILNTWGEKINGGTDDPGTFNGWLKDHDGYADGDLLVWAASNPLGGVKFYNYYRGAGSLSVAGLQDAVNNNRPTVVNVRSGSHWVLVVGYDSGTNNFYVNDPGFDQSSYAYSCMSNFVMYQA